MNHFKYLTGGLINKPNTIFDEASFYVCMKVTILLFFEKYTSAYFYNGEDIRLSLFSISVIRNSLVLYSPLYANSDIRVMPTLMRELVLLLRVIFSTEELKSPGLGSHSQFFHEL